jgi:hypothetical protein
VWAVRLVSAAVVLLVAGLAAATFVLSYAGVRDLAVAAGVPWRLARLYPAILDGVLVVACAAAYMLRDSSIWRRLYAWFAIALLVSVIGASDAIHAMSVHLPKRPAAGTVAALPWALVMLGFSLWLTMLRHARTQPAAPAQQAPPTAPPVAPQTVAPQTAPPVASVPALPPVQALPAAEPPAETRAYDADEAAMTSEVSAADEVPENGETEDASPQTGQVIVPQLYRVRSTPLPPEELSRGQQECCSDRRDTLAASGQPEPVRGGGGDANLRPAERGAHRGDRLGAPWREPRPVADDLDGDVPHTEACTGDAPVSFREQGDSRRACPFWTARAEVLAEIA